MKRRALAGAVAVVIATVTVSVIEGTPHRLPGVALGSPVLLHAERALALLAVTAAALSILMQAARGRLPIELSTSGLRYQVEGLVCPTGIRSALTLIRGCPAAASVRRPTTKLRSPPSTRNVVDMPGLHLHARMLSARRRTPGVHVDREARERVRDGVVPTGYPG